MMNNTELTMIEKGILAGIKNAINDAIKEDKESILKKKDEDCTREEDYKNISLMDVLKIMSGDYEYDFLDEDEEDEKDLSIDMDITQEDDEYSFTEMIEEFENGYTGLFSDGENKYKYENGTLLSVFDLGVLPADITSSMLNNLYIKEETIIDNYEALDMAIEGDTVTFELDVNGTKVTGQLTSKDGVPSYKVNNPTSINNSDIILLALFKGIWNL